MAHAWAGCQKESSALGSELCWHRGQLFHRQGKVHAHLSLLQGYHVLAALPPDLGTAEEAHALQLSRFYRPYIAKTRKLKKTVTPTRETVAGAVKNWR